MRAFVFGSVARPVFDGGSRSIYWQGSIFGGGGGGDGGGLGTDIKGGR